MTGEITVAGVTVAVVRKKIRHVHLRISAPEGHVRVTAPWRASDESVRRVVVEKLDWIRRHQARIARLPRAMVPTFVAGELHEYLGRPMPLVLIEGSRRGGVVDEAAGTITLFVAPDSDVEAKRRALLALYRRQLLPLVPPLMEKWQAVIGVRAAEWRVRQMKTRWGTCNIKARRIWLNLELIRKPPACLEFIVVHELVHLLERRHNARFRGFMDQFLPDWRVQDRALKQRACAVDEA
jgi:hypothetical protein